jgi:hypothetical protein
VRGRADGRGKRRLHRQRHRVYLSDGPVAVGDTYSLYTEVEAAEGETVVDRPTVGCAASA